MLKSKNNFSQVLLPVNNLFKEGDVAELHMGSSWELIFEIFCGFCVVFILKNIQRANLQVFRGFQGFSKKKFNKFLSELRAFGKVLASKSYFQ